MYLTITCLLSLLPIDIFSVNIYAQVLGSFHTFFILIYLIIEKKNKFNCFSILDEPLTNYFGD